MCSHLIFQSHLCCDKIAFHLVVLLCGLPKLHLHMNYCYIWSSNTAQQYNFTFEIYYITFELTCGYFWSVKSTKSLNALQAFYVWLTVTPRLVYVNISYTLNVDKFCHIINIVYIFLLNIYFFPLWEEFPQIQIPGLFLYIVSYKWQSFTGGLLSTHRKIIHDNMQY